MGLLAALFVVILAVTGLLLNHSQALGLSQRHVASPALLDWYGIHPPAPGPAFHAAGHWLSRLEDTLYLDGRRLAREPGRLVGLVMLRDVLVAAVEGELLLLTPGGELVERLTGIHGVPAGMEAVGKDEAGRLVVRASHGDYVVDEDFLAWRDAGAVAVRWSRAEAMPVELHARQAASHRGNTLTLERVLLDLHSGRLFATWGSYLMDGAAMLLLGLAGSGVWHWARRRR